MKPVHVYNLRDGTSVTYQGIAPEQAVICAYAQRRGDWHTWNYESRYGVLREYRGPHIFCGDWGVVAHG